MSTEVLRDKVREVIDYHVDMDVTKDGNCGCDDTEQREWQERVKYVGPQAYKDHVYEVVMGVIEANT